MRLIGVLALISLTTFAHAEVSTQIKDCRTINNSQQRLACYDAITFETDVSLVTPPSSPISSQKATATLSTQASIEQTNSVSAMPKKPKTVQEQVAEFGAASIKIKDEKHELEKIYLEVTKVKKNPYGEQTFYFSNNQVWKQTESRRFRVKKGTKVFIEKAALGSFLLGSDDRNTTIRVKRLK